MSTASKRVFSKPDDLVLSDGSAVEADGARVTIRAPGGAIRVVYEEGQITLFADAADVVLQAKGKTSVEAEGELTLRASETLRLEAPRVEVKAGEGSWIGTRLDLVVGTVETTARRSRLVAEDVETVCTALFEQSREVLRETSGLIETRAGRIRTLVEDAYRSIARRTTIESEEDTRVDGKRVLLG